jgi:hypothetical protein
MKEHIKEYAQIPDGCYQHGKIDRALHSRNRAITALYHVKSFGCTPEIDAIRFCRTSATIIYSVLYLSLIRQQATQDLIPVWKSF